MKTLTVQEASQSLGDWLRRAARGEQIAIHEGNYTVVLQPVPAQHSESSTLSARESLRELQSRSPLTSAQAEEYLREVHNERLSDGRSSRP